ncbi:uncharacterized protein LOC128552566 [Mercenaria mercenaria]|uniref:uncharacterized protein LOC128552566 n=1 Tax=Mercenaria mercenaria TaxID=6596 RepID=UPI00234F1896|nr:uncharacterized protein LOC128552566 [Mercenaria mercenaria]
MDSGCQILKCLKFGKPQHESETEESDDEVAGKVQKSQRRIYSDDDQELTVSADPPATRRGMKRRWNTEEDYLFIDFFKDEITLKKMPTGGKILQALKILKGQTVAQIRTRSSQ